jgi:hypothetical protein
MNEMQDNEDAKDSMLSRLNEFVTTYTNVESHSFSTYFKPNLKTLGRIKRYTYKEFYVSLFLNLHILKQK